MTYGKVRRDSMYLRSHPYDGGLRASSKEHVANEIKEADLWNAFDSIKKYIVSSAADLVKKITGASKRTASCESVQSGKTLTVSALRHTRNFEAQRENLPKASWIDRADTPSKKSWMSTMMSDPNLSENVKLISRRMLEIERNDRLKHHDMVSNLLGSQRRNRRYIKPRDPTTSRILSSQTHRLKENLSFSRPNPHRLSFGEIDSRSKGIMSTPSRQNSEQFSSTRSEFARLSSKTGPYRHPPLSYRRPWSSTVSNAGRFVSSRVGPSSHKKRSGGPLSQKQKDSKWECSPNLRKSSVRSTEVQTSSPMYPRKIFSWEQSGRKDSHNEEDDSVECPMMYTDPIIKPSVTMRSSIRSKLAKKDLYRLSSKISSPQFVCRLKKNLSDNTNDVHKKRKNHSDEESVPTAKRPRFYEMKESTFFDLNSSKTVNPINEGVDDDDDEKEQVCLTQPKEESKIRSVASLPEPARDESTRNSPQMTKAIFPLKEENKSKLCLELLKTPDVSCTELLTQAKGNTFLFPSPKCASADKPPVGSLTVPPSGKDLLTQVAETSSDLSSGLEPGCVFALPATNDESNGVDKEDGEEKNQSIKESHNQIDIPLESTEKSSVASCDALKLPSPVGSENISYACRMAKMRKIKIRDHYTSKIEDLYDKYCKDNGKDARKLKAVSMYKDKYHKLQQDHSFFSKLCKQYNVNPGEEYTGVDSNFKSIENQTLNEEYTEIDPSKVTVPADVVDHLVPKKNAPHQNPFDVDHVETTTGTKPGMFDFTKSSLRAESKGKLNDVNLFGTDTSSNTSIKGQLFANKENAKHSLFAAKDVVTSKTTNPFILPAVAKPTLFGFTNTKTPASTNLFWNSNATSNVSEIKNNFTLNPADNFKVEGAVNAFNSSGSLDMSMMDSEDPAASNTGSRVPPQNLFGSSTNKIGTNSTTNLFGGSSNKIGVLSSTNLFGSADNKTAVTVSKNPFTSVSGLGNPFTNTQFRAGTQLRQSDNPFSKTSQSVNPFSTPVSSGAFGGSSGILSNNSFVTSTFPNKIDFSKGVKFSLGSISRPVNRKRRPIVRGRRTLK